MTPGLPIGSIRIRKKGPSVHDQHAPSRRLRGHLPVTKMSGVSFVSDDRFGTALYILAGVDGIGMATEARETPARATVTDIGHVFIDRHGAGDAAYAADGGVEIGDVDSGWTHARRLNFEVFIFSAVCELHAVNTVFGDGIVSGAVRRRRGQIHARRAAETDPAGAQTRILIHQAVLRPYDHSSSSSCRIFSITPGAMC